ncbi:MAG: VOC family protein [Halobacteriaceae archaeon]
MADVLHTAVWVSDLDATAAFYEDGLGLAFSREFEGDDGVTNYFVTGESDAEIQFKYAADESPDDPAGIDHLAVEVPDTDAKAEELGAEYDSEILAGPMDHGDARIAFVTDPDGYGVELIS